MENGIEASNIPNVGKLLETGLYYGDRRGVVSDPVIIIYSAMTAICT